jgi:hypothetical protein
VELISSSSEWCAPRMIRSSRAVRLGGPFRPSSSLLLAASVLIAIGCDEPKKKAPAPEAATSAPAPVEPPPSAPVAEEPQAPPRTYPKLADCPPGPLKVEIQSPELEGAIRVKAQKPDGPLTAADLRRLRSLNLSRVPREGIDVCLFKGMTELRELSFGPDQIDDLSPLAALTKLESLSMTGNPVSDLSPLQKLLKLDRLTIAKANITDLSPLANLKVITEVNFDDNPVEDISVLANMKDLERVSLQRTKVASAAPLSKLKSLKSLHLAGSPLGDDIGATAELVRNGTKVFRE